MSRDALKLLTVSYPAGETIVAAGERGSCMFVVQDGSVRLMRADEGAAARTEVGVLEKGDFFGEGALLDGHPYATDAEAITDCDVVEIGPSTFQRMLVSHPEIAVRMMRKLAGRLDRLEVRLTSEGLSAESDPVPHAAQPAAGAGAAAADVAPAARPAAVVARLVCEGNGESFVLEGAEALIGRYDPVTEVRPEVDLTSADTKRSVSRRHARLTFEDGGWQVSEEVGTLNGTFVNGDRVQTGRSVRLSEGDVISLGMVRLVFKSS